MPPAERWQTHQPAWPRLAAIRGSGILRKTRLGIRANAKAEAETEHKVEAEGRLTRLSASGARSTRLGDVG